ncbi:YkgJ family cysteine cluster protein [Rufibacter tibetensis]|uniref:YkgJ family cysteine cluster protein n=1 Tax=Rufibacter tibetensis TaxID=512763 RepID=UPI0007836CE1|nr:YkgJ family cysteine cluster protein [Rufibacter tibetensis]
MSDASNLCLSCGLCCEGTVIGFVQVGREELPLLRDLIDVENTTGDGFFLQPCKKYCDGCTIYARRPKQCAKFECGLLKSLDQKKLSFDSAIEVVKEVKQLKTTIESKIALLQIELHSQSFYFQMIELNKLLQKNTSELAFTQDQLNLIADLKQLDSLLLKEFGDSMF